MRFFRRRSQFGYLALLALAVQLAASFGHIHTVRAGHDTTALACRTFFQPVASQPCPPSNHDDKSCPVCLTINMSGSLVLGEPPALAFPQFVSDAPLPDRSRTLAPDLETAAFQARAPPISL
jgi:hypothetical protein